jgi:hypothetical protein
MTKRENIVLNENGVFMDGMGKEVTVVFCRRNSKFPWKNPDTGRYYASNGEAWIDPRAEATNKYDIFCSPYPGN